ncbi:hypothetical protein M0R45_016763 [Rubus argutus]|uniref:Uncharacterized protein n=1 Tax=Rubus argutus TaxID=59490 RepID=A0AAW1XTM2_RUBAR
MLPFSFSPREKDGAIPVHGTPPLQNSSIRETIHGSRNFPTVRLFAVKSNGSRLILHGQPDGVPSSATTSKSFIASYFPSTTQLFVPWSSYSLLTVSVNSTPTFTGNKKPDRSYNGSVSELRSDKVQNFFSQEIELHDLVKFSIGSQLLGKDFH